MISIVIIKVRAAVVTVWHVLAVNVRLSTVSHPYFYQAIMIYLIYPSNPWPVQCQTVGASIGLQAACSNHNDQTCQILCQDPTNSQECIQLTSLLIDGSPCGRCYHMVQTEYFVLLMSYRFRRYLSVWKVPSCWIFRYCQGSFVRSHLG